MKKILSISTIMFAAFLGLTSCVNEEELLFDKTAAERLNEASTTYSSVLQSGEHGWALEYFPATSIDEDNYIKGVGYLMMVKFGKDFSSLVAMKNAFSGNEYLEDTSAWEVITDNGPVLTFNTFNKCMHAFSNPEDILSTADDETGKGMLGDYEFVMVDVPENAEHILLKGKKRGSYSRLTRLTEQTDFEEYINDVQAFQKQIFTPSVPNYNVLTVGENKYKMVTPPAATGGEVGNAKFWEYDADSVLTKQFHPYLITRLGNKENPTYRLRFRNAIGKDDVKVQDLVYDADKKIFYNEENPEITLVGENASDFFEDRFNLGEKFQMNRVSEGSTDFTTVLNDVYKAYQAIKFTFNNVQLVCDKEQTLLVINYRTDKNASGNVRYKFNISIADGKLTLNYVEPFNTAAQTQMNSLPAIAELVKAFEGTFTFADNGNPFNLTNIKMVSAENASKWVVVTNAK